MSNAYEELAGHQQKISDLQHVQAITSWDEAAMMPAGGGESRAQAMSTLSTMIHGLVTDSRIPGWLAACESLDLSTWQAANVREIARDYRESSCLPGEFVGRQTETVMRSEQAWRTHRAANDWNAMQPHLEDVVAVMREEAELRASGTNFTPYGAMLDLYEPGMTVERVDSLFGELKSFLPAFLKKVTEKQAGEPLLSLGDKFAVDKQRELGLSIMRAIGFDFDHGRLDISHHPFCGGVSADVRITTRYTTDNFVESLMAVIHETGHAMYEQGRPEEWVRQPVGRALSAGTHESQSLLMEMQACRSRAFLKFAAPIIRSTFGASDADPAWQEDNLHRLLTRVEPGLIRVDADEVSYPLHVILRYEIEKDLINREIEVADLPALWQQKMQDYLGRDTEGDFTNGVLQDVHWPAGLFGYFPTYSLGAMMAAQFFTAASQAMPELHDNISRGDFGELVAWLRDNVHGKGKLLGVDELLESATGEALNVDYFRRHLESRYGEG